MDQKQLFIPDKIKVGFQERGGTYTGKLAYVIYFDQKGVLRKEKSWESWRDKKIDPIEFDNKPIDGFVLNKGVGGQRQSYGWNARNEYIRVYDPRDFEFEISVANLLFILRECDCSRGKGLEGKFVYAWDGTELVLLPECSTDFQNSQKYTELQGQCIKAKDLIPGASYTTKKQEALVYLGKFDCYFFGKTPIKKWIFWDGIKFILLDKIKTLAVCNSETPVPNYAELVDQFYKSAEGSKVVKLFTKPYIPTPVDQRDYWHRDYWVFQQPSGEYLECGTHYDYRDKSKIDYIETLYKISFKDGLLTCEHNSGYSFGSGSPARCYWAQPIQKPMSWIEPTNLHLYAELESGSQFRFQNGSLIGEKNG